MKKLFGIPCCFFEIHASTCSELKPSLTFLLFPSPIAQHSCLCQWYFVTFKEAVPLFSLCVFAMSNSLSSSGVPSLKQHSCPLLPHSMLIHGHKAQMGPHLPSHYCTVLPCLTRLDSRFTQLSSFYHLWTTGIVFIMTAFWTALESFKTLSYIFCHVSEYDPHYRAVSFILF